ncbi:MAG: nucleotidyltransferase domain-containing protein [Armatimonadetes bacterium]|nr:nucleotidyltransferase domain-containing protein [Armatimonadota bacterium]
MLPKSLSGVKVKFVNKEEIIFKLKEISAKILKKNSQVKTILLFGSYVNNTYTPYSDVDILIVLKESNESILERIPHFQREFLDSPAPVEIFPYTEKELLRMKQEKNFFIINALERAIILS